MRDDTWVIAVFVVGIIIGCVAGYSVTDGYYQTTAIKHSCAQHNSTTGDFEWIKP